MIDFNKIKKYQKHPLLKELRDIRVLGLVVFGVIVLLVSWSGVRVIDTNYKLQQKIARMEEESKLLELENKNKKLQNEYYNTDQYLELQARKQFGKAAPGETVLIVPESVALKNSVENPEENTTENNKKNDKKSFYRKNLESWMEFLFHRKSI